MSFDPEMQAIGEIVDEVMADVEAFEQGERALDVLPNEDSDVTDDVRQAKGGLNYALVGISQGRFTARCGFCGLRVRHGVQYGVTKECPRCGAWFSKGKCEAKQFHGEEHLWGVCRYCVDETLESLGGPRRR